MVSPSPFQDKADDAEKGGSVSPTEVREESKSEPKDALPDQEKKGESDMSIVVTSPPNLLS